MSNVTKSKLAVYATMLGLGGWALLFGSFLVRIAPKFAHVRSPKIIKIVVLGSRLLLAGSFFLACAGLVAIFLSRTIQREPNQKNLATWALNGSLFLLLCGLIILKFVGWLINAG